MQEDRPLFWLKWTLATLIGYIVGIPAVLFISLSIPYGGQPPLLIGLIGGAELGATIGIAQWLVLRRYTSVTWFWVVASIVGGALGMAPGMYISEGIAPSIVAAYRFPEPWAAVWQYSPMGALFGVGLGIGQWWVLCRHAHFVGWWIVANGIGWMVGQGAFAAIAGSISLAAVLVPGLLAGAITGYVVVDAEYNGEDEATTNASDDSG
jgi:hypothetical protein